MNKHCENNIKLGYHSHIVLFPQPPSMFSFSFAHFSLLSCCSSCIATLTHLYFCENKIKAYERKVFEMEQLERWGDLISLVSPSVSFKLTKRQKKAQSLKICHKRQQLTWKYGGASQHIIRLPPSVFLKHSNSHGYTV